MLVYIIIMCVKIQDNMDYGIYLTLFQGGEDLEEEIAQIQVNAPYIVVMESSEATSYDVVVERESLFQSTDIQTALIDLFGAYFVFDIAYPPELYSVLIFFQHYVFGLTDKQKVPVAVSTTVSTMRRLD